MGLNIKTLPKQNSQIKVIKSFVDKCSLLSYRHHFTRRKVEIFDCSLLLFIVIKYLLLNVFFWFECIFSVWRGIQWLFTVSSLKILNQLFESKSISPKKYVKTVQIFVVKERFGDWAEAGAYIDVFFSSIFFYFISNDYFSVWKIVTGAADVIGHVFVLQPMDKHSTKIALEIATEIVITFLSM